MKIFGKYGRIILYESYEDVITLKFEEKIKNLKINIKHNGIKYLRKAVVIVCIGIEKDIFYLDNDIYRLLIDKYHVSKKRINSELKYIQENYQKQFKEYFNTKSRLKIRDLINLFAEEIHKELGGEKNEH